MEIFLDYAGICPPFWDTVRIILNKLNLYDRITGDFDIDYLLLTIDY